MKEDGARGMETMGDWRSRRTGNRIVAAKNNKYDDGGWTGGAFAMASSSK